VELDAELRRCGAMGALRSTAELVLGSSPREAEFDVARQWSYVGWGLSFSPNSSS
jgi:hypothetical protein